MSAKTCRHMNLSVMVIIMAAVLNGCASMPLPGVSAERFIETNTRDPGRSLAVTLPIPADQLFQKLKQGAGFCWTGDIKSNAFQPAGPGIFVAASFDFQRSTTTMPAQDGGGSILVAVDGALGRMYFFGAAIKSTEREGSVAEVFPVPRNRQGEKYRTFVTHLLTEGTLFCHHVPSEWSLYVPKSGAD